VTDAWYSLSFGQSFSQAPRFVAWLATRPGGSRANNAGLRYRNLGQASVQVKVEEDTTLDPETSHTAQEAVHYLPSRPTGR
jgi:serralysin